MDHSQIIVLSDRRQTDLICVNNEMGTFLLRQLYPHTFITSDKEQISGFLGSFQNSSPKHIKYQTI